MIKAYKYSKKPFKSAAAAVKSLKEIAEAVETEIAALPAISPEEVGAKGIEARQKQVAALRSRTAAAAEEARQAIEEAEATFFAEVERNTTPNGSDFTGENSGDFEVLRSGLVNTPAELESLYNRHTNSEAFKRLAEKYASEKGWKELEFAADNTTTMREYAGNIFDTCRAALVTPTGYAAMCMTEPRELERRASEYGVAAMLTDD